MHIIHDITAHEQYFAGFVQEHITAEMQRPDADTRPLCIKQKHSAAVLAHARVLVQEEAPPAHRGRACVLAALYHDVARFPQYLRWRTFKDNLSTNHGWLGVKVLKAQGWLQQEVPPIRAYVLTTVGIHNRVAVPQGMGADIRFVTDVVRDADKLDILRVMAEHLAGEGPYNDTVILNVQDAPDVWSPKVMEDVMAGRVAAYADLTSVNDFRLLLGSWMNDMRFAATRRALAASKLIPEILQSLPDIPALQHARHTLLQRLEGMA